MKKFCLLMCILFSATLLITSCEPKKAVGNPIMEQPDSLQLVQRGDYLVNGMGCDDCHSPKKMGAMGPEIIPELRFSGYPAARPVLPAETNLIKQGMAIFAPDLTMASGPWGTSFAANISSDESGIGNWTEENFINCMRKGKYKGLDGSRGLLPPMPWYNYAKLNDNDLKSIFAYLKTTKPVSNIVPSAIITMH